MRELRIIEKIKSLIAAPGKGVIYGLGDDCAVLMPPASKMLVSTDTLVEGRHFNLSWHHPFELATKAVAVNVSDIAAMGGVPRYVSVSFSYSDKLTDVWISDFVDGLLFACKFYDVTLIGGDTVKANEVSITLSIIGEAETPVYRSGARAGDVIYVAGPLGSAGGGLYLFETCFKNEGELASETKMQAFADQFSPYKSLLRKHLSPIAQPALGAALAKSGLIGAMQDLSDGLATDLAHIARASGVVAVIYENMIPVSPELQRLCMEYGLSADDLALKSGDDYLLLFTVPQGHCKRVEMIAAECQTPIYPLGRIEAGAPAVMLEKNGERMDISYQGYQH